MTPPLVVLGLDAADPDFLRQWAAEGHLPTLASIMERGSWARTSGPELVSEHGTWSSIFSGISRAHHGYHYYRQLRPGTYDLCDASPPFERAPPFWAHLRGSGPRVAVIDAPDSRPLPGIPGIQLADWAPHDTWNPGVYPPASEPPELLEEVRARFGHRLPAQEDTGATIEEDRRIFGRLLEHVATKGRLCRHLLLREDFELIVVVFSESHAAGHQFWRYGPRVTADLPPDQEDLRDATREVYAAIDREIGRLLAGLPGEADVVILSSVGLEDDFPSTGLIEAALRAFGYQVPADGGPLSLRPLDLARKLLPESWRVALSRRLPRERRELLLADAFRSSTDWERSTAFAVPGAYTSFVRVNLRGREPRGVVAPGSAYDNLLGQIERDLLRLVDPASGEPAVTRVSRSRELFGTSCHPALPDLFVAWRPGRYLDRVLGPEGELRRPRPDFFRRSDHSAQGFVAAAGPHVAPRGEVDEVDVLDLAPSLLHLLGRRVPAGLDGRPVPWVGAGRSTAHV